METENKITAQEAFEKVHDKETRIAAEQAKELGKFKKQLDAAYKTITRFSDEDGVVEENISYRLEDATINQVREEGFRVEVTEEPDLENGKAGKTLINWDLNKI